MPRLPQAQQRPLRRKNKVYQISPTNECLVNFERGLFHFYNPENKKNQPIITVQAKYILNLCAGLDIVQSKEEQSEESYIVAFGLHFATRMDLEVEHKYWIRQNVRLVEYQRKYNGICKWPGYAINFNCIDIELLKHLYLKCRKPHEEM